MLSKAISELPARAVLEPDDFRRDKLYTKACEHVLKHHWPFLTSLYDK